MTPIVARLILALVVIAASAIIYFVTFILFERNRSDEEALIWSGVVTALFAVSAWLGIWWHVVRWTSRRMGLTAIFLVGSVAVTAISGLMMVPMHRPGELVIIIACMVWAVIWFGGTPLVWVETKRERAQRLSAVGIDAVACPNCGYNMTGLKEARCPECGAEYTIDQLVAAILEQKKQLE